MTKENESAGLREARLRGFRGGLAKAFASRWDANGGETAGQAQARLRGFTGFMAITFANHWDAAHGPDAGGDDSAGDVPETTAVARPATDIFALRAQQSLAGASVSPGVPHGDISRMKTSLAQLDADEIFSRRRAESAPPRKEEAELKATFARVASSQLEVTAALPLDAEAIFSRRRTEVETTHATVQERSGS